MGICSLGLKNEFETAVVNEPSVFEPLQFYCTCPMGEYCISFYCIVLYCIVLCWQDVEMDSFDS